jgi:hypothetical protein
MGVVAVLAVGGAENGIRGGFWSKKSWYSVADYWLSGSVFCCVFVVGLDVAVFDAAAVVG